MKCVVSGASGLIGSAVVGDLAARGHTVRRLVRRASAAQDEIPWDPATGTLTAKALEDVDGVVHLAGEGIAARRWTARQKARIRDSRVNGTRLLCDALATHGRPGRVLVCASAIGYYGNRGDEIVHEDSSPGMGFLPDVCQAWEAATKSASQAGVRVVNLRIGVVLSAAGGALKKMLLPFRLGLGGKVGKGNQYMSWIAIDDVAAAIRFCLEHDRLRGPVNAVSPNPATNAIFTRTLGRVLHRPTWLPMPAAGARLAFGQLADELLLSSTRVEPRRLVEAGFPFAFPELAEALAHVLERPAG